MPVFTLMLHCLYIPPRIQRIPLLFIPAHLLVSHLLIIGRSLLRILILLLMILCSPLNLYSYNSYMRLGNRYIVLGTLLILRSVVGRMLSSLRRISLRNVLSLITLDMHILSFSLFNSRILQTLQILPPLITHSGNVLLRNMYRVMLCLTPRLLITLLLSPPL